MDHDHVVSAQLKEIVIKDMGIISPQRGTDGMQLCRYQARAGEVTFFSGTRFGAGKSHEVMKYCSGCWVVFQSSEFLSSFWENLGRSMGKNIFRLDGFSAAMIGGYFFESPGASHSGESRGSGLGNIMAPGSQGLHG